MRPSDLLHRTSFRLAATTAGLVIVTMVVAGMIILSLMDSEFSRRHQRKIAETFSIIAKTDDAADASEVIETVKLHADAAWNRDSIYVLQDENGHISAGNVAASDWPLGWTSLSGRRLGLDNGLTYRLFKGKVPSGWLTVGASTAEIDEMREIAVSGLIWSAGVVLALAFAGGLALALQAQRRYDQVRATMTSVAEGDLSARIPLSGHGDDLDVLAREINAALDRLGHLVEGMRQVSTDIAHDLRIPLNRLKMRIDDAITKHQTQIPVADELEAAAKECSDIGATFAALLRIAQLEAGARRQRFSEVDLAEVITHIADVYDDVAEDAGMHLDWSGSGTAPVHGDRDLLQQLFANLVDNAINHCPRGSRISLSLTPSLGGYVASVADDGPGIPAAEREMVLRRLYRLDKSRATPGSGLGLSLVKAIADAHAARLRLDDNAPGLRVSVLIDRWSQSSTV